MKRYLPLILLAACAPASAQDSDGATRIAERNLAEFKALLPGVYTNEEQHYFQGELDLPEDTHLPRLTLTIEPDGDGFVARTASASGRTTEARLSYRVENGRIVSTERRAGQPDCSRVFTRAFEQFRGRAVAETETCGGEVVADRDGFSFGSPANPFLFRRASAFTCWVAPQKPDGSYGFVNDVELHDAGGRAWVEGEDFDTVGLRMRKVSWPAGNNRDSLVLYVHRADDTEWQQAESYAWTSPDEPRIGMNLRWVQVSCTRGADGAMPTINLETGSGR